MNIYGFYNFDYDDTVFVKLANEKEFSKDKFEEIVNECRQKVEEKLEKNLKIIEAMDEDAEMSEEEFEELNSLSSKSQILRNVLNMLIKEHGFFELEPKYTFVFTEGQYWTKPETINKCK